MAQSEAACEFISAEINSPLVGGPPPTEIGGDDFVYDFLRMEMKRQHEQRRAMRRMKDSGVEILDRFRESVRYRRELQEGKLTITPEQAIEQNVNLMPHFEDVHLRRSRRVLMCAHSEDVHRRVRRSVVTPEQQMELERSAREQAVKQYGQVVVVVDNLMKYVQERMEESAKRRTSNGATGRQSATDDDITMLTINDRRVRDLLRQTARELAHINRDIHILDEQFRLFDRARDRLDLRYKAAMGTRPGFIKDILLMTGGLPNEPYILSIDLRESDVSVQSS
jgi:hypothetical protein